MRLRKYLNENKHYSQDAIIELLMKNCSPFLKEINLTHEEDFIKSDFTRFYRGVPGRYDNMIKLDVQKRTSRGTYGEYFPIINKWLKSKGHVSRDFCISATSDIKWAQGFGNTLGIVFPIGNFKYTFVRAGDFNDSDNDTGWNSHALVWLLKEQLIKVSRHPIISAEFLDEAGDELIEVYDNQLLKFIKDYKGKDFEGKYLSVEIQSISEGGWTRTGTVDYWNKEAQGVWQNFETNNNIFEAEGNEYEIWFDCKSYYLVDPKVFGL